MDENGRPQEPGDPPARHITVNQVIAWNLAWYRNLAGLTQEELGAMTGTTKSAVSELERSWNGKRPREFDAQFIASVAAALKLPLLAFFLPPVDDGEDVSYWFTPDGGGGPLDMEGLMRLVMPDNEERTDAMEAYRDRLVGQVDLYLSEAWAEDVARWLRRHEARDALARRAARLRNTQQRLEEEAADAGALAAAIEAELAETEVTA